MSSSPVIPPEDLACVPDALTALACAGLPAFEARMLVPHATDLSHVQLTMQDACAIDVAACAHISGLAAHRLAGEPIVYLLGKRKFFGRTLEVTPAVLILRPDTELLVEQAPDYLEECDMPAVLDTSTGSGIIAITIMLAWHDVRVWATDASINTPAVVIDNAEAFGATSIQAAPGDWYGALAGTEAPPAFDLIASGPPYIAATDTHLDQGDPCFEPTSALTDHDDGLRHLRSIVTRVPAWLVSGG